MKFLNIKLHVHFKFLTKTNFQQTLFSYSGFTQFELYYDLFLDGKIRKPNRVFKSFFFLMYLTLLDMKFLVARSSKKCCTIRFFTFSPFKGKESHETYEEGVLDALEQGKKFIKK